MKNYFLRKLDSLRNWASKEENEKKIVKFWTTVSVVLVINIILLIVGSI